MSSESSIPPQLLFMESNLAPLKSLKDVDNLSDDTIKALRLLNFFNNIPNFQIHIKDLIPPITQKKPIITLLKLLKKNNLKKDAINGLSILCKLTIINHVKNTFFVHNFLAISLQNSSSEPLIELVLSDINLFQNFIYFILENISSNPKPPFAHKLTPTQSINILSNLLQFDNALKYFDTDFLDFVVQTIHNLVLNDKDKDLQTVEKTLHLFIKFDNLAYNDNNIVTCSNIDKILQFHVSIDQFKLADYIEIFNNKDADWIENSILSLERQLFQDLDDISYSSTIDSIPWNLVLSYLNLHISIMNLSTTKPLVKLTTLRPIFDLLTMLSKLTIIPVQYNQDFKIKFCQILHYAYHWDLTPFEHLKFFLILFSYVSYSTDLEIRSEAFSTINEIQSWDKNSTFVNAFKSKETDSTKFAINLQSIISSHLKGSNYFEILPTFNRKLSSDFSKFNFDECFYTLYQFEDLHLILKLRESILSYPKPIKDSIRGQLQKLKLPVSEGPNLDYIKLILQERPHLEDLTNIRIKQIPLYPGSSKKEVRLYLFTLLLLSKLNASSTFKKSQKSNKSKTPPQAFKSLEPIDLMICDMFRFDEYDIMDALVEIFNSFSICEQILDNLIQSLSKQNGILLEVVLNSPKLIQTIANTPATQKFKILKACLDGNPKKFSSYLSLFSKLIQSEFCGVITNHPILNVLRTIRSAYLDWELNQQLAFWDALFKNCIDDFKNLIKSLNIFLQDLDDNEDYLLVNKQMMIPLTANEVENSSNEELNRLISIKVGAYKQLKDSNKPQKSQKPNRSKKKKQEEKEIVKVKKLNVDQPEEIEVSITIYPKGKSVSVDDATADNNFKKLSSEERKALFLGTSSVNKRVKIAVEGKSCIITSYSDHFIRVMVNAIFKGLFQGKVYIGNFVGYLFHLKTNFIIASDDDIKKAMQTFRFTSDLLTTYLYIKIVFYLKSRGLMTPTLMIKLNLLKSSKDNRYREFIEAESKVSK